MAPLADFVRLIGLDPVNRVAILVREDRDSLGAQLIRGAEGADRNFASVGDQNLGEHRPNLSTVCYCADTALRSGVLMVNRTVTCPDTVWVAGSNSNTGSSAMSLAIPKARISRGAAKPGSRSDTSARSRTDEPKAAA